MLVSATEMLKKAKAGHYAVGQFNINNLEWTKGYSADRTGAELPCNPWCFRGRRQIYDRLQDRCRHG